MKINKEIASYIYEKLKMLKYHIVVLQAECKDDVLRTFEDKLRIFQK